AACLAEALADLEPPFAYLDFETVAPAIPVWNGCRPYDAVPVQLSVHREDSRGRDSSGSGRLSHHEWLADGPGDPREEIARRLIEFTEGARTILAYYASFECARIQDLKERLPGLAARLGAVEDRLRDVHPLVRDYVYHPGFKGSFSLKSVA